jgi:DNA polymerase III epsilon subunit family exonuclease
MWLVVFIIIGLVIFFLINTSTPPSKSEPSSNKKLKNSDIKWEKLPDDFVIFDFETTGLKTNKTPVDIIEIAAIKVKKSDLQKGLGVETFSALVKPWRGGLNPEAMAINKITQKMIDRDGEDMSKVIHEFMDFVGDRLLVGYNVDFDRWFLQRELADQNISKRYKYECAYQLAKSAFPNRSSYRLTTFAKMVGVDASGAHRALKDCEITMHLYIWAKSLAKYNSYGEEDVANSFEVRPQNVLKDKTIVFTGTMESMSREVAEALAQKAGLKIRTTITSKTTFLVAGDEPGTKLDKALEIKTKVLSEKEFLMLLKG